MKWAHTLVLSCAIVMAGVAVTPDQAAPIERTYKSIPQWMLNATVRVQSDLGSGSGVAVAHNRVITAAHVVDGHKVGDDVMVEAYNNKYHSAAQMSAKILKVDKDNDVALLETDGEFDHIAVIDWSAKPETGDKIFIIGAPYGLTGQYASEGFLGPVKENRVSADHWKAVSGSWAASAPGNSGGPVFDANTGSLLGLLVGGIPGSPLSFFVPAKYYKSILK